MLDTQIAYAIEQYAATVVDVLNQAIRKICNRIGHSMGTDIHDILAHLYVAHPDLIPDGFLFDEDPEEWAKKYKRVLRREKKQRRDGKTSSQ